MSIFFFSFLAVKILLMQIPKISEDANVNAPTDLNWSHILSLSGGIMKIKMCWQRGSKILKFSKGISYG